MEDIDSVSDSILKDIKIPDFNNLLSFNYKRKVKLDLRQSSMNFANKSNSFKSNLKKQISIYSVKSPLKLTV